MVLRRTAPSRTGTRDSVGGPTGFLDRLVSGQRQSEAGAGAVKPWHWHSTARHFSTLAAYASLLIAQGETVRDQMGHHSIRVTVDVYGHLVPGGNKAAVDRLDDASDVTSRNPAATATRRS